MESLRPVHIQEEPMETQQLNIIDILDEITEQKKDIRQNLAKYE